MTERVLFNLAQKQIPTRTADVAGSTLRSGLKGDLNLDIVGQDLFLVRGEEIEITGNYWTNETAILKTTHNKAIRNFS